MGITSTHGQGRNGKFFVNEEATAGTFAEPAATDALKILTADFQPDIERRNLMDTRSHRSMVTRVTGKSAYAWTLEAELRTSGTKDTAPDLGPLIEGAMGTETVNGGTSVAYSLASTQTLKTYSLVREYNSIIMEALAGAWIEEMKIVLSGGDEPKISFAGGAMSYIATGNGQTNGALSGGESAFTAATADQNAFEAGSMITIGSSTNHKVSSRSGATVNVTPNIVGAQADPVDVIPYVPSETTAGTPISGILGSMTWDSFAAKLTGLELTLKNSHRPVDGEILTQNVSDVIPGFREVTGTMTLRVRKDHVIHMLNRSQFGTKALSVAIGTATGNIWTIAAGQCELNYSSLSIPESDEVTVQLPFVALGSSGNDEFTLTQT